MTEQNSLQFAEGMCLLVAFDGSARVAKTADVQALVDAGMLEQAEPEPDGVPRYRVTEQGRAYVAEAKP